MRFGIFLMRRGVISAEQLVEALEDQMEQQPPLGQIAIEEGVLSVREVFAILRAQSGGSKERFGDAAMDLGLLSRQQVATLLMLQADRVRSLTKVLVTQGVVDQETVDAELAAYRRNMERSGTQRANASSIAEVTRAKRPAQAEPALAF